MPPTEARMQGVDVQQVPLLPVSEAQVANEDAEPPPVRSASASTFSDALPSRMRSGNSFPKQLLPLQGIPSHESFPRQESFGRQGDVMQQWVQTSERLESLACVTYEEAERLLTDQQGVEDFFREKQVPSIGKALAIHGVAGSSIHMLTPRDIETSLDLHLGQQLALKNFIRHMQTVSSSRRRAEHVWMAEEAPDTEQEVWKSGCCCMPWCCCYCCCCASSKKKTKLLRTAELQKAKYTLTTTELSIETWSWVDPNLTEPEIELKQEPNFGCGSCCGYTIESKPQQCTTTNNIDLSCIEDVDSKKYTATSVAQKLSCTDVLCGFYETQVTPAATVHVTYVERGSIHGNKRTQVELKVKPDEVHGITRRINAERDLALDGKVPSSPYSRMPAGLSLSPMTTATTWQQDTALAPMSNQSLYSSDVM